MFFQTYPSIETVTYIVTIVFSCFTIYKTTQYFYSPVFNTDTSSVGTPTIMPSDISRTESVASTITPGSEELLAPIPVPDPTYLMVPAPFDHVGAFIDAIKDVFMLLAGF